MWPEIRLKELFDIDCNQSKSIFSTVQCTMLAWRERHGSQEKSLNESCRRNIVAKFQRIVSLIWPILIYIEWWSSNENEFIDEKKTNSILLHKEQSKSWTILGNTVYPASKPLANSRDATDDKPDGIRRVILNVIEPSWSEKIICI